MPRKQRPYPNDPSDARWELLEPTLTAWRAERRGKGLDIGRPPEHDLRRIMDAILYVDRTGIPWRYLPHDFAPWETVYGYFPAWQKDEAFDQLKGDPATLGRRANLRLAHAPPPPRPRLRNPPAPLRSHDQHCDDRPHEPQTHPRIHPRLARQLNGRRAGSCESQQVGPQADAAPLHADLDPCSIDSSRWRRVGEVEKDVGSGYFQRGPAIARQAQPPSKDDPVAVLLIHPG